MIRGEDRLICHRKKALGVFLIAIMLLLPGCWSLRELNEIGIVSALGVDLNEQGNIKITVQVITPQASSTKGQTPKEPARFLSSEGKTFFEAIRNLMEKSGDRLFYPHTQVFIIGEELARSGLNPVLDFLARDPEIRLMTWVILSQGKAEDVVRAPSKEDLISAMHLNRLVEDYESTSKSIPVRLLDLSNMLYSDGKEPVLGKVQFYEEKGEPTFKMAGGGAFKGDKLIGWLDEEDARGYLWVNNDVNGGIITASKKEAKEPLKGNNGSQVMNSSSFEERISYEIIKTKSKIKPILEGDVVRFVIDVDVTCNLGERMDHQETIAQEGSKELEKILSQAVIREVQVIVDKAQKELKSDILGFGLAVNRKYPKYWAKHKEEWDEIFPKVEVEIVVKAIVDDRGTVR